MSKVAHYLQQHLAGEVLTSPDVLRYFSTDESILEIKPMLVVHPRSENDLRKAARFSWQLSERGRIVPITIKGKGTDQTGASLGSGIVLTTPAHLNKIIELDQKSGVISAEAGANAGKIQQTLLTHGRYLPSLTSAAEYSTIGGSVANNDAGSSSYKYGPIREYVRGLRVVLSNGELIRTERLSKREVSKKLGLASFEGEIYRSLDKLIEESQETIESLSKLGIRNNSGYAIGDVKSKDGSIDLTPLLVGSQGTLGLISEVTLDTEAHPGQSSVTVALFDDRTQAWLAVKELNDMKEGPISVDFVDRSLMQYVQAENPNLVKSTLEGTVPTVALFIETEEDGGRGSKKNGKKIAKILESAGADIVKVTSDNLHNWMSLRDSSSVFLSHSKDQYRAVPIIDDAAIPPENCANFVNKASELLESYDLTEFAFWGQAGSGIIRAGVLFDLSQVGQRQKLFKLIDEYYQLVVEAGGTIAASFAEGRLRATQADKVMSQEQVDLMQRIKKIFDPHNMLNPGVKVAVDAETLKPLVRNEYTLDHQYSHLPRS